MRRFPPEFEALLSPRGAALLAGRSRLRGALVREAFLARTDLLDPRAARACLSLLERHLGGLLMEMEEPLPPESISGMTENYSERLPKTVRVRTALLESRRARAFQAAQGCGLVQMLRSESFRAFAAALAGRPLKKGHGIQALCYGPGDYTGPHNDHHPEEAEARDGYLDLHLTFASPDVAQQLLVYERGGHLSECVSIATLGGVTAYRLPFWHYTTPLQAKRGRGATARRWVLLGTFLFDPATHRISDSRPSKPAR